MSSLTLYTNTFWSTSLLSRYRTLNLGIQFLCLQKLPTEVCMYRSCPSTDTNSTEMKRTYISRNCTHLTLDWVRVLFFNAHTWISVSALPRIWLFITTVIFCDNVLVFLSFPLGSCSLYSPYGPVKFSKWKQWFICRNLLLRTRHCQPQTAAAVRVG